MVYIRFRMLVLAAVMGIASASVAQDRRAQEAYEKGQKAFSNRDLPGARKEFQKAVERDTNFGEAYFKLGQLDEFDRNIPQARLNYEKAIALKPDSPEILSAYQWVGSQYLREGNYAKAQPLLQKYVASFQGINKLTPIQKISLKRATRMVEVCQFATQAMKNPLKVEVKKLPQPLNSFESQYFPVLTADQQTLFFTGIEEENGDENIYLSSITEDGSWTKPRTLSTGINTTENEGTSSISADGRTLVFTVCQSRIRRGYGNCDLYISYRKGNEWSSPENLGQEINSGAWDSQPTLSPDGRLLFFVSDRPGGVGKRDIWMSRKDSLGRWLPAVNAGAAINTSEDEVSPFLHANGQSLFFASDGYTGLGGFDIWLSDFNGKTFSKPENLGYPINTHEDQVALYITADGRKGYYSQEERIHTDRRQSRIWELRVPEEVAARFKRANVLKGRIVDALTKKPVSAQVEVVNLKTNQTEVQLASDAASGEYATILADGNEYAVFVHKPGYLYKSLSFDFSGTSADKVLNLQLEPIQKNQHEVLKNVFFETAKWDLEAKSEPELQKLIRLLKENVGITIEVSGHTDDVGDDKRNMELSLKRAKSVSDYLIAHGIDAKRIKAAGYGESKPVLENSSDENRAQNRRIEVKIL